MRNNKELTPQSIYAEYNKASQYNNSINLKETVKKNENFYIGRQWEGIKAPDLEKPVLNFLHRVVAYFISQLVSDDIGMEFRPAIDTEEARLACAVFKTQCGRIVEKQKMKSLAREMLRNAAVDGDGAFYFYYDTVKKDIRCELTDNTKVLFCNPHECDIQAQDRVLVIQRQSLETVRNFAERVGIDPDEINQDYEDFYGEENTPEDELVTVINRFWKDADGFVHFCKSTKETMLVKDTNLGYRLFPIAWMQWEKVKGSYHGESCITNLIPNQIFVNKLTAMSMEHNKKMAFPKLVYDRTRIPEGWNNTVGQAIGVVGDVTQAVSQVTKPGDMSQQAIQLIDKTIDYSKELMGASDAALGDIKPENTSAIIATQKASAAPLELQRQSYYQFWEDCVLIMLELMRVHFGTRTVSVDLFDSTGESSKTLVDFSFDANDYDGMDLAIDIGASAYWSEIAQAQTADQMLINGIFTDPIMYLECIPDHLIKGKSTIMAKLRAQQTAQAQIPVEGSGRMGTAPNDAYDNATGEDWLNTKTQTVENQLGGINQ